MDRNIVYPGAIPLDTDVLSTNLDMMIGVAALTAATLGQNVVADGLVCTPTNPTSLAVVLGEGSITQISPLDATAYGSLPANLTNEIVKMGINIQPTTLELAAPTEAGQSINYLIEAAFQEIDAFPVVLPYVNAANPSQPLSGVDGNSVAQNTKRIQRVQFQLKAGTASTAGTQTTPAVDNGWVGLYQVTVNAGQTVITQADITTLSEAPFLAYKLPSLRPGFSSMQVLTASNVFSVPSGVTTMRVKAVGGGGGGGYHNTMASGGGGAGGQATGIISGLVPGQEINVTIGEGGAVLTSFGDGNNGGDTLFGTFLTAGGGGGGDGGTDSSLYGNAGGTGGSASGGILNVSGSYGTDSVKIACRGGDGGGPGNGRGTTGPLPGINAVGYGGGGGGGGASTTGASTGYPGGAGAAGVVIIEY